VSSAYCILHLYASTSVVHMYIRDTICMLYSVVGLSDNDKCLSVFCFILIPLFLASTFVTTYTRTHTHTHTHTCAASIELNTLHKTPSKACRRPIVKPRLHQVHVARIQVVSTCIPYRRLLYPVSATKSSLTWNYGDMYPLVSGYKLLVRDTCIRKHVSGVYAA